MLSGNNDKLWDIHTKDNETREDVSHLLLVLSDKKERKQAPWVNSRSSAGQHQTMGLITLLIAF